ncbi:DUF4249 domain-containing protein [Parabacteroides sp. 52]|uniref:DUF4249 domain-containing protein n=1 Tax=unclassified Parabacteroides TaxID=2649774 RepID=UPI0013D358C2|nr:MULTISPECIES: DUF4249 domain-containing protein [unclassified Parabacteroides]MDH6535233.1 hypothetical protein [Parabacteroides sp. PM5-20]NDV55627.1 DUF4249 domain-containing protein [Parabacteroides sp. 52]
MKTLKYSIVVFLLLTLLKGCIEPYEPKNVQSTAGVLVVEGMLLEDAPTVIKLSRTISLDQSKYLPVVADVSVLNTQGDRLPIPSSDVEGTYILDAFTFEPEEKYALDIRIGSEHYQSSFEAPIYTPQIDSVGFIYKKEDLEVDIYVSTHDAENKLHYYRWLFEEDWEVKTSFFAEVRWDPEKRDTIAGLTFSDPRNRFFCWANGRSNAFLLGNSERLSQAVIKDKVLHTIKYGDYHLSSLYSILVKQYALSDEAYNYFRNLQKNIDEAGSIFAPQPTEMEGNIRNLSNSSEPVIGYFSVVRETRKRLYISATDAYGMIPHENCDIPADEKLTSMADAYYKGYGIKEVEPRGRITYAPFRCVDCTTIGGASKKRPAFWPNDHY